MVHPALSLDDINAFVVFILSGTAAAMPAFWDTGRAAGLVRPLCRTDGLFMFWEDVYWSDGGGWTQERSLGAGHHPASAARRHRVLHVWRLLIRREEDVRERGGSLGVFWLESTAPMRCRILGD